MSTTDEAVQAASKTAQPPVPPHPDPATHNDGNRAQRIARLRKLEAELNDASVKEVAQATVDKIDGKAATKEEAAETEEATEAPAEGKAASKEWQRIEDAARKEAGLIDDKGQETSAVEETDATEETTASPSSEEARPAADPAKGTDEERDKAAAREKERKERFEKTLKLQAKLRERDERIRAVEERLSRKETELADREQLVAQRLSKGQQRVDLAERVLELATQNPLELLERAGVPPEKVAQWIREAGDPAKQETRGIQKEISDLKTQLQQERQQQQQERQRIQAQREQERVESEFLSYFDNDKDAFEPARIAYTKRERIALANEIAEKATKRGIRFTLRDVAEAVNETAKDAENYQEFVKLKAAGKTAEKPAEKAEPAAAAAKPAAKAPAIAVTQAATQQRGERQQKAPKDWKEARKMRLQRRFAELDAGKE